MPQNCIVKKLDDWSCYRLKYIFFNIKKYLDIVSMYFSIKNIITKAKNAQFFTMDYKYFQCRLE
jgi:hypothetical protein